MDYLSIHAEITYMSSSDLMDIYMFDPNMNLIASYSGLPSCTSFGSLRVLFTAENYPLVPDHESKIIHILKKYRETYSCRCTIGTDWKLHAGTFDSKKYPTFTCVGIYDNNIWVCCKDTKEVVCLKLNMNKGLLRFVQL